MSERSRTVTVDLGDRTAAFHFVWLRDNCWCEECRVTQTGERRLLTWSIPPGLDVETAEADPAGTLRIRWSDGHESTFSRTWLRTYDYSEAGRAARRHDPTLWDATFRVPRFSHAEVIDPGPGQLALLDTLRDHGVAMVTDVPSQPLEVERFAEALGHVREVAFERVHNVFHDPSGYNVAHTTIELKPHTDMPSYHWPPSVQLLHFLVNEAAGGESVVVDGWKVLADLRSADRAAFDLLCRVPVAFQLYSPEEDSYAVAPMVQVDSNGAVQTFRFSNQLAQPLDVDASLVEPFYHAYRRLGEMIDDPAYRVEFKTRNGDLLVVHGHRVLHGRLGFVAGSGPRHLQDVYMEWDDLMARRRVLLGEHIPTPANEDV